jgi:glucose-1-phosphate cytidylyltransferase
MRVVILAGGLGTRLSEETERRPKPMVEIGGRPILWHVMKGYAVHDVRHFVVALGYLGEVVKQFFLDYRPMTADLTVHTASGDVEISSPAVDDWTVDLVDTGPATDTGGRILRLRDWLPDDTFCLTYGDGVGNVDIPGLLEFHAQHDRLVTITAIRPPSRFGGLVLDGPDVVEFTEKPQIGEGWINGGFMAIRRGVFDYITGDETSFEKEVLERLADDHQLRAYQHEGFWQSMDTLRDVRTLQGLWESGKAPWKTW